MTALSTPETDDAPRRRRSRLPGALTLVAALVVVAVWVLERYPGEDWWLTTLLTWAPQPQWIVPPALMLLVSAIARRPVLILVNLAAALFALLCIAGFQINSLAPRPTGRPAIRVATWNVYGGTRDRETVQHRVRGWDCDVVCLQEAGSRVYEDLLPGYEGALSHTLRIFVRGDILRREAIEIATDPPRTVLIVDANTRAGPVTVITVHIPRHTHERSIPREIEPLHKYLASSVETREKRFAALIELLPADRPLILAGDMNTPPASRYWRRLDRRLTDSFDAAGFGFGYSFLWRRKYPLLRIDYIWTGGGAVATRCWTRHAEPSDHRPVIADIAISRSIAPEGPPTPDG